MSEDLFGGGGAAGGPAPSGSLGDAAGSHLPLAVRMRPRTVDEIVGQGHLLGPGSPLRRLAAGEAMSVFLWGPPGVGKTTIASVVSQSTAAPLRRGQRRHRGRQGGPGGARPGPPRPARRPGDRPVRRRGAPLLQDPAGRAAAGGREPAGHPGRRDDGEPQLLGDLPAAVALAAADAEAAHRRRRQRPARPRAERGAGSADRGRAALRAHRAGPPDAAAAGRR